jgi:hypothetical protein
MLTVDFQDSLPFTMAWPGGSRDISVHGAAGQGSCANGVYWSFTRVAPGANNGGYNNRGYVRYTWCDYDVSRVDGGPSGWSAGGNFFRPAGGWPADTFYGRFRIYIEQPMFVLSGGHNIRQMKFFLWHQGVWDGDQRVIGFLESGPSCGRTEAQAVCFTLQRNILHYTDTSTVPLPVGQWSHVQFSWKHGAQGTSWLKIWLNNNSLQNPTAQDLSLSGLPALPGGTSMWFKDNAGYDAGFNIGNNANPPNTRFSSNFVYRLMDFQLDSVFNGAWAPGASTAPPSPPQNLHILR